MKHWKLSGNYFVQMLSDLLNSQYLHRKTNFFHQWVKMQMFGHWELWDCTILSIYAWCLLEVSVGLVTILERARVQTKSLQNRLIPSWPSQVMPYTNLFSEHTFSKKGDMLLPWQNYLKVIPRLDDDWPLWLP